MLELGFSISPLNFSYNCHDEVTAVSVAQYSKRNYFCSDAWFLPCMPSLLSLYLLLCSHHVAVRLNGTNYTGLQPPYKCYPYKLKTQKVQLKTRILPAKLASNPILFVNNNY
jgi:hypothetical protein